MLRDWALYLSKNVDINQHVEYRKMIRELEEDALMDYFEKNFKKKSSVIKSELEEFKTCLKLLDVDYCTIFDEDYPIELKNIYDFPLCLYLRGNRACLSNPKKISIIGTRKPTYDGIKMCDVFVKAMSRMNMTIVSGLAFGIDIHSHMAALKYSCPAIVVLGTGIDDITPRSHFKYARQILENGGLILSEYPPNSECYKVNFVVRNRIISGLSMDLFVVEAGEKSGSLTTVNHAMEQSRNIYAMPGSVSNPVAWGTNWAIKQGAGIITEPLDFEPYRLFMEDEGKFSEINVPKEELLDLIKSYGVICEEELFENTSLSYSDFMSKLMEYELLGYIDRNVDMILFRKE